MFSSTDNYFDFLPNLGFKGPYEYNNGHEMQSDYVKGDLIIKIAYDGRYWVYVIKTKKVMPELEMGTRTLKDFDFKLYRSYDLEYLDPKKKLFNSIDFNNKPEKYLWYYSKLLRDNPEILGGNLSKFSLINYLLRKLGLKK
jgi:hypothetical protein